MNPSRSLTRGVALAVALAATYGCTGGLSCGGNSGCGANYAPYPQTEAAVPNGVRAVDDGIRARLTQQGLDVITRNMSAILASQLPTRPGNPNQIVFELPPTQLIGSGSTGVRLGNTAPTSPVESFPTSILIDVADLESNLTVTLEDGTDSIRLTLNDLPIGLEARVYGEADVFGIFSSDAACDVVGTACSAGDPNCRRITDVSLDFRITPRVGTGAQCNPGVPECVTFDIQVLNVDLGSFGGGSLAVRTPPNSEDPGCNPNVPPCSRVCSDSFIGFDDDEECDIFCGVANFAADIALSLTGFLVDILQPLLATALETAINDALSDLNGSPIGLSDRLALSTLVPGVLPASTLDLGFAVQPTAGAFVVDTPSTVPGSRGLNLNLKSGFEAAPDLANLVDVPHPCVKTITGAEFAALYGGFDFEAAAAESLTGEFGGEVYSLGASLAKDAANQALFAAYNTGALCIELSSDAIAALSGGAAPPISAGTLDILTGGRLRQFADANAPTIIAIAPSQPPVISYGAGDIDANDGHIKIDWPGVEISFYVLMYERFSRVFGVETDISAQLIVFNDPVTQTLRISIFDGPNVDNFNETYNELLPGVAFTEILESLVGAAFDAALGDGLAFDYDASTALADALGVPLFVNFLGIETLPAADRQFLNVYLQLSEDEPQPQMARLDAPLVLPEDNGLVRVVDPELGGEAASVRDRLQATGELRVEGASLRAGGDDLEFFARVDYGAWRGPFRPDAAGDLVIKDPKLSILGEHTVWLRPRFIDAPNSLAAEEDAQVLTVWNDPEAPRVALRRVGNQLVASGSDLGTLPADLVWQWQRDDGSFDEPSAVSIAPLSDFDGVSRVAVRALDRAGNVSKSASVDLRTERLRLAAEEAEQAMRADVEAPEAASSGCAQSGSAGGPGALVGLVGLLSLLRLRGVRRRRAPAR